MFNVGNRDNNLIRFDGKIISDDLYNLKVVDIGEEKKEEGFGINRSTAYVNNTFLEVNGNRTTITVTFLRVKNGVPIAINDVYEKEILTLFFKPKTPVNMEINGRCYKVMAIDGSIKKFIDNVGYFSITFESAPYASNIVSNSRVVVGDVSVELNNNGVTDIAFDLNAKCVEDGTITIKALKGKGDTITLTGKAGQEVTICGDHGDSKGNINWDCSSISAFELVYGINRYAITSTGKWNLTFTHENELAI